MSTTALKIKIGNDDGTNLLLTIFVFGPNDPLQFRHLAEIPVIGQNQTNEDDIIHINLLKYPTITKEDIKIYFAFKKKLVDLSPGERFTTSRPRMAGFGVAKMAEVMRDVKFFNELPHERWNINLEKVNFDQLNDLTGTLVLHLLLDKIMKDVVDQTGITRIKEKKREELIPVRMASRWTTRTPSLMDLSTFPLTNGNRSCYTQWTQRLIKFATHPLGKFFIEKSNCNSYIMESLQVTPGKRDKAAKFCYASRRQYAIPEQKGFAMGCQTTGKHNCDNNYKPCNKCQGLTYWIDCFVAKDNGPFTQSELCAEIKRIRKTDSKYNGDYSEILNGNEWNDGVSAQESELTSKATSNLTKRYNKTKNTAISSF
jgi:hypothetical protein